MSKKNHIYVISCGIAAALTEPVREIIDNVTVLAGGRRLLAIFAGKHHQQIVIGANAVDTIKALIKLAATEDVAILASGDALFHGIAGTLEKLVAPEFYTIIPNITAFQALCAKLKQPWSEFKLFSIHGKNGVVSWRKFLAAEQAVIYCDNCLPASALSAELIKQYPATALRPAVSCANLGMDDEVITHGTLQELAELKTAGLSMLLLLKPNSVVEQPALPLGLDDRHYEHENSLITHPETRAVIISKLRLRGGVMWDLGAGSGSVGIEAAGLRPNLKVYAVEKSLERVEDIISNTVAEGLDNHYAVAGDILTQLEQLPKPDVVFIGGGGKDIKAIVEHTFRRLRSGGRIVVSAVTLETVAALGALLKGQLSEVVTVGIARSKMAGSLTMMKAENQITIFTYEKDEG
jgi:precorrin-6Y C5,15-methyltransferase (decarboxylating)